MRIESETFELWVWYLNIRPVHSGPPIISVLYMCGASDAAALDQYTLLTCCMLAEPVLPVDNFDSSLDGANAVFKKSVASNNVATEEAQNTTV